MEREIEAPTKKRKTEETNIPELPSIRHLLANITPVYSHTLPNVLPSIQPPQPQIPYISLKIVNEPDTYQISNYNLQPVLAIELPSGIEESVMKVELLSDSVPVDMGFQAASTQVISRNSR